MRFRSSLAAAAETNPRAAYRADIDGLRAVAIVAVILFHCGVPGCAGGFLGVDVFFVISGYLITGQILRDLDTGSFSLLDFWTRRARRIVPALAAMTWACVVCGWFLFFPGNYRDLGQSVMAQAAFASNAYFRLKAGYFTSPAETKPLLHTWSISIEEQFYLVFPVLLGLAWRWGRSGITTLLVGCLLGSFGWSLLTTTSDPDAAFYLLPSRAWELAIGCLAAAVPRAMLQRMDSRAANWLAACGAAAITFAFVWFSPTTRWPAPFAAVPCLGTAALLLGNAWGGTTVGRLLATPGPAFIGRLSYSLYLWHWPFIAFARYASIEPLTVIEASTAAALSVPVALASYRWLEQPCRTLPLFRSARIVLPLAALTLVTLAAAGTGIYLTDGVLHRRGFQTESFAADATAAVRRESLCRPLAAAGLRTGLACRLGDVANPGSKVLLIGDSFADMYLEAFRSLSQQCDREVWFMSARRAAAQTDAVEVASSGHVGDVVVAYSWRRAVQGGIPELAPPTAAAAGAAWSRSLGFDPAALFGNRRTMFRENFSAFVERLVACGVRVHVVDAPPYFPVSVPLKLGLIVGRGADPAAFGVRLSEQQDLLRPVHEVFAALESRGLIRMIRPTDVLCDGEGFCRGWADGHSLYSDDAHLSVSGAEQLEAIFREAFATRSGPSEPTTSPLRR